MKIQRHATVVTERPGEGARLQTDLSPDAVAEALRRLAGAHDVTMTVSPNSSDERLMIAIDGSHAVLGLESPDGLLQFVTAEHHPEGETFPFTIGRQQADIETRFLLDLPTAVIVVREWLEDRESSDHGSWEHQ